jgi:hypothetical protein
MTDAICKFLPKHRLTSDIYSHTHIHTHTHTYTHTHTRSELNSVFCLEKVDRWNFIRTSAIQSRSRPMRFLGSSNHEKRAPRQEISKWSTVCRMFSRSGWSVVRSTSLAKGGTSKKRPSPHLHKVPTRSSEVSPRTFQMALVRTYVHTHRWMIKEVMMMHAMPLLLKHVRLKSQ